MLLQLKIMNEWVVLPDDFALDMISTNPLFNDDGDFSHPFEIPLSVNRHVFKNIADPFGNIRLEEFNKQPAEIWFDGNQIFKGITEFEDTVDFDKDTIAFNVVANNAELKERISGMSCQDVPHIKDIFLGQVLTELLPTEIEGESPWLLPDCLSWGYPKPNMSVPYDSEHPYCNAKIACKNRNEKIGGYYLMPADRPFSGLCYYVLYFVDCLFYFLGTVLDRTSLSKYQDLFRLAFFSTRYEYEVKNTRIVTSGYLNQQYGYRQWCERFEIANIWANFGRDEDISGVDFRRVSQSDMTIEYAGEYTTYRLGDMVASSKGFPDANVSDVIDDLSTAFGIRFLYDSNTNVSKVVCLKDVFSDKEVLDANALIVEAPTVSRSLKRPIKLTYNADEDDTSFNYTQYDVREDYTSYADIVRTPMTKADKKCRYDIVTGNAYRVKVMEETGDVPQLFEVGNYHDFFTSKLMEKKNGEDDSDRYDVRTIGFTPVVVNNVAQKIGDEELAVFVDEEMGKTEDEEKNGVGWVPYVYDTTPATSQYKRLIVVFFKSYYFWAGRDNGDESPLRNHSEYSMGFLRGLGNEQGVDYDLNYDDEGNDAFYDVYQKEAFTADSIDNFGRLFDYNGEDSGGASVLDRLSLKLDARKVKEYDKDGKPIYLECDTTLARRGLVHQLLAEYLYFEEHKMTVTLTVKMSLFELQNINYLKRYRFGDYVGYINKMSYKLYGNGMSTIKIELLTVGQ